MSKLKREILVLQAFFTLYVFVYPGSCLRAATEFFGFGDSALYVWLTAKLIPRLLGARVDFQLPFFYPEQNTLAFSDNYLLPAALSSIVYLFKANLALAYNLPLLLAAVANGYATYLLARELSSDTFSAFISGVVFMLAPFFFSQAQHPQLQFAFFLPLSILFLVRMSIDRDASYAKWLGLCWLGAFLTSVYYFFITVLSCLTLFFIFLLVGRRYSRVWMRQVLFGLSVPILFIVAVAYPYISVSAAHGVRSIGDVGLGVTRWSFLAMPPENIVWGTLLGNKANFETVFGCGSVASLLALFALLRVPTLPERGTGLIVVLLSILFFVLALGPLETAPALYEFQPYVLLYKYFPGFSALRAAGRFGIVPYLGVCLLAGFGWKSLSDSFFANKNVRNVAAVVCAFSVAVELACSPYPFFSTPPQVSLELKQKLETLPGAAFLALPYPRYTGGEAEFSARQFQYMHAFRDMDRPMVNGYSGVMPKFHRLLYHRVKGFPSESALNYLQGVSGLRYVLYFSDLASGFSAPDFEARIGALDAKLRLLGKFDTIYLFDLRPEQLNAAVP